jgi:16S rRNA (guanine966-N2)-methyltransferase
MTGRARESLFSILASRVVGAAVLDLFAGSGSLGLEAMSRGADHVVFVEVGRQAVAVIRDNIEAVGLGGVVIHAPVDRALTTMDRRFDVVFVDPPYADDDASVAAVLVQLDPVLADTGLVVVHRQRRSSLALPEFLTSRDERRYGDAVVTMMERIVP